MAREITSMGPRHLFGGAITMDLPVLYGDASDLRQIPDNQEVFLSPNSDTSLVIEVLALVEEGLAASDLWEAAKYHFDSIAHDNASISTQILTAAPTTPLPSRAYPYPSTTGSGSSSGPTPTPTPTPAPTILTGSQKIHKFSHDPTGAPRPGHEADEADEVIISLALWRVWLEDPSGGPKKKADLVCSVNVNLTSTDGQGEDEMRRVEEWWRGAVDCLKIVDFGLFGDTE